MTESATQSVYEVRPRKIRVYAWVVAVILVIGHAAVGLMLKVGGDTGLRFTLGDQIGMAVIGLILAGGALLFTRPRLRIGPDGVAVRNLLNENVYDWDLVEQFTFPHGAAFAHMELPRDEFVAIWAIQARDGEHAAEAMAEVRRLTDAYKRP